MHRQDGDPPAPSVGQWNVDGGRDAESRVRLAIAGSNPFVSGIAQRLGFVPRMLADVVGRLVIKEGTELDSKDIAIAAARAASDKKAEDIVALDVAALLVVTDYFVICTAESDRQARTLQEILAEHLAKQRALPQRPLRVVLRASGREAGAPTATESAW